jgi:hypothetical protein
MQSHFQQFAATASLSHIRSLLSLGLLSLLRSQRK